MPDVGSASLAIIPSFKGFESHLERGTAGHMSAVGTKSGGVFGDAAGKSAGTRFGGAFKTAAKASLVGLAGLGVGAFQIGKDAIGEASDLGESLNAVNVTFGKTSKGVKRLGREAATSVGLSQTAFQGLAVQFSAFAKTISQGSGKGVSKTLDELTTRGADFASVMNLDVNESMALFQSGLAGETEPLRKYGIDLSAAKVEAFALSEGIVKNKDDLTEAAKVQARYALLMEQTAKTQGDFANTADSAANRQRILSARWDDAQAKLGKGLLPIYEEFVGFVLEDGLPAFERFSRWFNNKGIPAIKDFGDFLKEDVAPPLKTTAGYAEDLVGFLKDLPGPAKFAGLATILTGGAALKLRGGKGGLLGTAGSALGLTKPVPVLVMNKGWNTPGVTPKPGPKVPPIIPTTMPKGIPKLGHIPKLGMLTPVGLHSAPGQDSLVKTITGVGPEGSGGVRSGEDFFKAQADTGKKFEEFWLGSDTTKAALKRLGVEVETTRGKFVDFYKGGLGKARTETGRLSSDLAALGKVKATPHVQLTGVQEAQAQIAGLLATIPGAGALAAGVAAGAAAGSGGRGGRRGAGEGDNPLIPGATSDRGGVQVIINGDVKPNDWTDFATNMDRRSRRAQSDGVNRP